MAKKHFVLLLLVLLLGPQALLAQQTAIYHNPQADYRLALELFNKEKYGAAQKLFMDIAGQIPDADSEMKANALYYISICAVELFHPDAEKHLIHFIQSYPTHPRQGIASFQMGNLQYRKRNYKDALDWYAKVDLFDLSREQKEEFQFKSGYSHFMKDDYEKAKQHFFEIRNPNSTYFPPATYYYAHISYSEGNYETASIYFLRLKDDSNFGPVVPYYITHIYYLQEKYDEVLAYAPPLLESSNPRRAAEMARLIGEAHYKRGEFQEAIPYLEEYQKQSRSRLTREDYYQLAYAYYSSQDYAKAVGMFERVTSGDDALAQNAFYHLADCYMKTNQKRSARNAFLSAHRMEHAPRITQDALFNYAKLSYELSLNPYNEAILSFQKYIDSYPNSLRREEAYRYLIDLYLTTRNYRDALGSLEKIPLNTTALRAAYQRVAYFRGIELFNNGDFEGAIEHFRKSTRYNENNTIRAQSIFWQGEAFYRQEKYPEAIETLNRFVVSQGAFSVPEFKNAHYTIGYAHFKQKQYPQAITAFRKFIAERNIDRRMLSDANLRIADSYFITKDFAVSIEFYDRAIQAGMQDADYATFQKALALGVTGQFQAKINTLNNMLRQFPNTSYADDARYELANSYVILDNNSQALTHFQQVMSMHPNSSYVKSAMLKTGLIYYNTNQDERALDMFQKVISQYPGSPESQEALVAMRNIYVSLNRVDDFVKFSQGLGFANISTAQQDSLTYMAAENRYMQGDCETASKSFTTYLERFANGIFALNAHFYKAECDFMQNELQRALKGYEYVLQRPKSKFSENAVLRAAIISFRGNNFLDAHRYYAQLEDIAEFRNNILESRIGQMRSLSQLDRPEQTIETAQKVLGTDKVPQEVAQEAHLIIAKAALSQNKLDMAREHFNHTNRMAQNLMAAEAKYNLALVEFKAGAYERCEKIIFDHVNHLAAYEYWLAKTFILLADNYLVRGNIFQAKHTLESIIDNYEGEDLRSEAQKKLDEIIRKEKGLPAQDKPDAIEIEFSRQQQGEGL